MANTVFAQADATPDTEMTAIKAAVQSYTDAFNAKDAQKLAEHWAPEAVYISRSSGDQVVGRDAIAKEFGAMFDSENVPRLEVETQSIEFISPNVALERGVATVIKADQPKSLSNYSAIYVRQGGKWLLDRVTEEEIEIRASNYDKLKGLEWIIGNWVDAGEGTTIKIECSWTKNQNYISRKYSVSEEGQVESSGLQIIGWDPKAKEIRSWLFDSSGGFISGTWSQRDDKWIVQSVATFSDGVSGSFTSIFRPLEEGRYAWRKINRVVDGEIMPNVDEVVVTRE
jgi:uncharacterized protein (TIGR02246 family)